MYVVTRDCQEAVVGTSESESTFLWHSYTLKGGEPLTLYENWTNKGVISPVEDNSILTPTKLSQFSRDFFIFFMIQC